MSLPAEPAAERAVLGAALMGDAETALELIPLLEPGDFYDRGHEVIWQAIVDVSGQGSTVQPSLVESQMAAAGTLALIGVRGGVVYLSELAIEASRYGAADHARLVREASTKRKLALLGDWLAGAAKAPGSESTELVSELMRRSGNLAQRNQRKRAVDLRAIVHSAIGRLDERTKSKAGIVGVPTGLTELDESLTGLKPGHLIIAAGRPGMGKTAFVFGSMLYAAEHGHPGLFFSLEMDENETAERGISYDSRVDSRKMQTGMLGLLEWKRIYDTAERLAKYRVRVNDLEYQTLASIETEARRWRSDPIMFPNGDEVGLVAIDYLQLVRTPQGRGGRQQRRDEEISDITKGLRALAREIRCPIVLLSQLNRKVEERADKRPMASDLKESGAIEEDANVILMLYRDEFYNAATKEPEVAEIIIAKARGGKPGTIKVHWAGPCTRFDNLSHRSYP